eukprot:CAMPEP_0117690540 /NCGR_PEP_ID=MMETSP0804-20121206/25183_1 /TAXON_ID=1074897 /ORGANISM="Tetraselmis astigmatica, Strain CCMP880" /LENGTH=1807 /DNA_ID=CAMNT_0005503597 /DNA_START=438 /DNA_END=5863 /DNA_ORIENTATION=-
MSQPTARSSPAPRPEAAMTSAEDVYDTGGVYSPRRGVATGPRHSPVLGGSLPPRGAMAVVIVKSIFGDTWEVEGVEPSTTVAQLKRILKQHHDQRLGKSILTCKSRTLSNDDLIGDLSLSEGTFLTALFKRCKRSREGHTKPGGSGPLPLPTEGAAAEREEAGAHPQQAQPGKHDSVRGSHEAAQEAELPAGWFDTLVEGYNCRPGSSPLGLRKATPQWAVGEQGEGSEKITRRGTCHGGAGVGWEATRGGDEAAILHELQAELLASSVGKVVSSAEAIGAAFLSSPTPAAADPAPRPQQSPQSAAGHKQGQQRWRRRQQQQQELSSSSKALPSSASASACPSVSQLPLPPSLQRLERIFAVLNAVYSFMLSQHIQATWHNTRQAVQEILDRDREHKDRLEASDLEAMARLAPEVVVLRDRRLLQAPPFDTTTATIAPTGVDKAKAAQAGATTVPSGPLAEHYEQSFVIELKEASNPATFSRRLDTNSLQQAGEGVAAVSTDISFSSGTGPGERSPPPPPLDALGLGSSGLPGLGRGHSDYRALQKERAASGRRVLGQAAGSATRLHRSNAGKRRVVDFHRQLVDATAAALDQGHGAEPACRRPEPYFEQQQGTEGMLSPSGTAVQQERVLEGHWLGVGGSHWNSLTLEEVLHAVDQRKAAYGRSSDLADGRVAGRTGASAVSKAIPRPPRACKHGSCTDTSQLQAETFLEHLRGLKLYKDQMCHVEHIPAKPARFAEPSAPLSSASARALRSKGAAKLFTHQAAAIDAALAGRHVVVCASTASGKSLCYNIPVMEALVVEEHACAIYMFPTKALAQDQLRALRELLQAGFGDGSAPLVDVYDGDTPVDKRGGIRDRAQLLITNPDMLHCSILPVHSQFSRLLANLRYVIIDEGHYYSGVFGAHTALVVRRLRRVCREHYGSSPQFIVTSATMANPKAHTQELLGVLDLAMVDCDGSPHGQKSFVLWNPPLKLDGKAARRSQVQLSRRAQQQAEREQKRQANQARGSGSQLGRLSGEEGTAEWLAACKVGRRQGNTVSAAAATITAASRPCALMPGGLPSSPAAGCPAPEALDGSRARGRPGSAQAGDEMPTAATQSSAAAANGATHHPQKAAREGEGEERSKKAVHLLRLEAQRAIDAVLEPQQGPGTKAAGRWFSNGRRGAGSRERERGTVVPPLSLPSVICKGGPAGAFSAVAKEQIRARMDERVKSCDPPDPQNLGSPPPEGQAGAAGTRLSEWRASPMVEAAALLAECVQHNVRALAFCMTCKLCELVTSYTREILRMHHPELEHLVAVYRAGYSASERRGIERRLHCGELRAVCATNALELGMDVGDLDVTMHLGFAGSVASLWQQAGRAGRRGQHSIAFYIAFDGPLCQYFMKHPQALFGRPIEQTTVDAHNPQLLTPHLVCAAAEMPLRLREDDCYFGSGLRSYASAAVADGNLAPHPRAELAAQEVLHYVGKPSCFASGMNLRTIDPNRITIVNEETKAVMEEVEENKAFFQVYPGAIYHHQGRSFLCKSLDLSKREAVVRPVDVQYYTKTRDFTDVHVVGGALAYPMGTNTANCPFTSAAVQNSIVTVRWFGFNRVWKNSGVVFDSVPLHLPDVAYETQAVYIRVPPSARLECKEAGLPFRDGVHAAAHAILNVIPLYLTCSSVDLATECDNPYDMRYRPERLLIYDTHPGGIGLAQQLHPLMGALLPRALELVEQCGCTSEHGCPSCTQHARCLEYNAVLHKAAAKVVLTNVLRHEVYSHPPASIGVKADVALAPAGCCLPACDTSLLGAQAQRHTLRIQRGIPWWQYGAIPLMSI